MSNKSYFIAINIKCDENDFSCLLDKYNINYFDKKIKKVKYYYDDLTFFCFRSNLTRSELIDSLKNNEEIKQEIMEFSFYDEID